VYSGTNAAEHDDRYILVVGVLFAEFAKTAKRL